MIHFAVILCGLSLIAGITCYPPRINDNNLELQNLLQDFVEARHAKERRVNEDLATLKELETDLLAEQIARELTNGEETQDRKSVPDDEDAELLNALKDLRSVLGIQSDVDGVTEGDDEDQTGYGGPPNTRPARFWCWWCRTGTKFTSTQTKLAKLDKVLAKYQNEKFFK